MKVVIDKKQCAGCGSCIAMCGHINLKGGKAQIDKRCTGCGSCIDACPNNAIARGKRVT